MKMATFLPPKDETADKEMEIKGKGSKGSKAERERFYAELEIWLQKRYKEFLEDLRATSAN